MNSNQLIIDPKTITEGFTQSELGYLDQCGYKLYSKIGEEVIVDKYFYLQYCNKRICIDDRGYVRVYTGYKKYSYLHRVVMNAPKGQWVDHINHNKQDNRKSNLRFVTSSQSNINTRLAKDNTTGYKGVSFNKHANKFAAEIRFQGEKKFLGYFDDPFVAYIAYKLAAKRLHGEFACLK